jgi:CheY-like chemotaxis protein
MINNPADLKLIFDALRSDVRDATYGVLGSVELLEDAPLSPAQRENCRRCRSSAHRVLRIIEDILMLSTGTLAVEPAAVPFSPTERIRTILEVLETLAEASRVVLEPCIQSTPLVRADAAAFEHAATRMVEYAIRAAKGGAIQVSLNYTGQTLWFTVVVTDPSADARENDLALHVARALLARMGGKLDQADSGYRISLQASFDAKIVDSDGEAGLPKTRVLIAEDSEESFELFAAFLQDQPCVIDRADDGEQAVAMATVSEHDVIFMDIGMPKLDGYAATRRIREWETINGRRHVPIVVLSASPIGSQMSEGARAGCSGYLEKPVARSMLISTLNRYAADAVL